MSKDHEEWRMIDCSCCGAHGVRNVGHLGVVPAPCDRCGGTGTIWLHLPSRVLALYPGGPLCGSLSKPEEKPMNRIHFRPRINPEDYEPRPADVWRKDGPIGALRVKRVVLPGYRAYDAGLPGVVVRMLPQKLSGTYRDRFIPVLNGELFARRMQRSGRFLFYQAPSSPTLESNSKLDR